MTETETLSMVQFCSPARPSRREAPRMLPRTVDRFSPLRHAVDALGQYTREDEYSNVLMKSLFSPDFSIENIFCVGMAGEGKSTFLNNLGQRLIFEGQMRGQNVELVRIDFADAAMKVKTITGKFDTTKWTSREWERAGQIFTGMYNRAKRNTESTAQDKRVFYLIEAGMTDDELESEGGKLYINRGGSLLHHLVDEDSGKPVSERKTLPIAYASASMTIPERASQVRELIPLLQDQGNYVQTMQELEVNGIIFTRRQSIQESFAMLAKGAPRPAINQMRQEMDDEIFFRLATDEEAYRNLYYQVFCPPFSLEASDNVVDRLTLQRRAALYATKLYEMGVLGQFNGLATVLYNVPQPVVVV